MREYCEDCPKFDSNGKVVIPIVSCKCDMDWPDSVRIDAIGRNGNSEETLKEHYNYDVCVKHEQN